jgi:phage terminase Nu1 subunit (DNA packaging protein)
MAKMATTSALPETVSLSDLRSIFGGVVPSYIYTLEKEGVVEKVGHDAYSFASIANYIKWLRKGHEGPQAWNRARTGLAEERAQMARMDRAEREGRTLDVADVQSTWVAVATTIRNKFLALAAKLAPRLASVRSAVEAQEIVHAEVLEILEELSSLQVRPAGKRRARERGEPDSDFGEDPEAQVSA